MLCQDLFQSAQAVDELRDKMSVVVTAGENSKHDGNIGEVDSKLKRLESMTKNLKMGLDEDAGTASNQE